MGRGLQRHAWAGMGFHADRHGRGTDVGTDRGHRLQDRLALVGRRRRTQPPRVRAGLDFSHRVADAWFVGPNVHYARGKWWATLTVLPQVHGSPDTRDGLELEEHEKIEVRLIAGINF